MYNVDKYFDFDSPPRSEIKPKKQNYQEQLKILVLIALTGSVWYFLVYLPELKRKFLEMQIQAILEQVTDAQSQDYSSLLTACQEYLQWEQGTTEQQEALESKREELDKAINWLKDAEKNLADENQQARNQEESEKKQKELEIIKKKKFHWRRKAYNWASEWLVRSKDKFETILTNLGGEEEVSMLDISASYTIHFPPSVYNNLTEEQKKKYKTDGYEELELDDDTRNFRFNRMIEDWEEKVRINPTRGEKDPATRKDNNALLYGTGGTGKTSIVRRISYESDCYPLIEIKGPALTPRKEDHEKGIDVLNKFLFTLCDIEYNLEDNYSFSRESNGEIRYILFVDEADNVCTHTALLEYTKLMFLKSCMEGISKEKQTKNLWIFATNYINLIDKYVYRAGRLSNPLDFSWTLGDFKYYCANIDEKYWDMVGKDITLKFPQHWHKIDTLNDEDNKWVNKFNKDNFKDDFLPFWSKFIIHPETLEQLNEIKEEDADKEKLAQSGIQLGEFLEFFWKLSDSKQLKHFQGKYEKPRKPTTEEIMPKITEAIDIRLKELTEQTKQVKEELETTREENMELFGLKADQVKGILAEICKKIDN